MRGLEEQTILITGVAATLRLIADPELDGVSGATSTASVKPRLTRRRMTPGPAGGCAS